MMPQGLDQCHTSTGGAPCAPPQCETSRTEMTSLQVTQDTRPTQQAVDTEGELPCTFSADAARAQQGNQPENDHK